MSVNSESISKSTTTVLDESANSGVYASLFEKSISHLFLR
ncbi:hypothetical protein PROPEN_02330 [Proteus penneri ATCC 35198]|nr:hypothetical protein PROPEN_02330 [Proteus penneri ATCC 35198]